MNLREQLSQRIGAFEIKHLSKTVSKEELLSFSFSEEERVSENATWVLTHLPKSEDKWLNTKRDLFIDSAMKTNNVTKKRLYLTLLERCKYEKDDIRTDFLDFCLWKVADIGETTGVQSLCMKLSLKQCLHYKELLLELKDKLIMAEPILTSIACKHQRKNILNKINQMLETF
ncbi:MAG: hypothetical protein VZQ58_06115 [Bacteroidales bacterium]|nr:hypothetical protein [Bacteroidales bacterium]